jgi:hypothetical protein
MQSADGNADTIASTNAVTQVEATAPAAVAKSSSSVYSSSLKCSGVRGSGARIKQAPVSSGNCNRSSSASNLSRESRLYAGSRSHRQQTQPAPCFTYGIGITGDLARTRRRADVVDSS